MCFKKWFKKKPVEAPMPKTIRFEGQNDDIVWSSKSVSKLMKGEQVSIIVPFSRVGICLVDGVPEGVWNEGRYTITANETYDSQDIKMYYINKTTAVPINWGTSSMIDMQDPIFEMPVRFGAHGSAKLSIHDPKLYLTKVVGTMDGMTAAAVAEYFRNKIVSLFVDQLAKKMVDMGLSYFELPTQLKTISDILLSALRSEFSAYGLDLEDFTVDAIKIPDETLEKFKADKEMVRRYKLRETMFKDMYQRQKEDKEFDVESQIKIIKAIGEAEKDAKYEGDINISINEGDGE